MAKNKLKKTHNKTVKKVPKKVSKKVKKPKSKKSSKRKTNKSLIDLIESEFFSLEEYKEFYKAVNSDMESWYLGVKIAERVLEKVKLSESKKEIVRKVITDTFKDVYKDGCDVPLDEFIKTLKSSLFLTIPMLGKL